MARRGVPGIAYNKPATYMRFRVYLSILLVAIVPATDRPQIASRQQRQQDEIGPLFRTADPNLHRWFSHPFHLSHHLKRDSHPFRHPPQIPLRWIPLLVSQKNPFASSGTSRNFFQCLQKYIKGVPVVGHVRHSAQWALKLHSELHAPTNSHDEIDVLYLCQGFTGRKGFRPVEGRSIQGDTREQVLVVRHVFRNERHCGR